MIYRLNHASLTNYHSAFITPGNLQASIYIEFCDRGDLDGVIREYAKRKNENPRPRPPEAFVWHAFAGLLDGLAYLQTGVGHFNNPRAQPPRGWIPILHRDVKPDNVLLRSRSTIGSQKYFYCVLSDFGLACEDRPHWDPKVDEWQKSRAKLGTYLYFAPEMCWDPYPQNPTSKSYFPAGFGHSQKTDIWALGAAIFNLCDSNSVYGHLNQSRKPINVSSSDYSSGLEARKLALPLQISSRYTSELSQAILLAMAWKPKDRPDAVRLIRKIEALQKKSGYQTQQNAQPLPIWATKRHQYYAPL